MNRLFERGGRRLFTLSSIIGLAGIALIGCGEQGNGSEIESCEPGEATTLEATFVGDEDYSRSTDPVIISANPTHSIQDPEYRVGIENIGDFVGDPVDQLGEVACMQNGTIVLSEGGHNLREYIREYTPSVFSS